MDNLTLSGPAEIALSKLQDTTLDPMQEQLFQAWAKANGIKKPDAPADTVDYRGIYKETGGQVLPGGELKQIAEKANSQSTLERILQERAMSHVDKLKQKYTKVQSGTTTGASTDWQSGGSKPAAARPQA